MKIVGELEQMVSEDITLDHRVHARIIGARGKAIRKIMDEFKVSKGLMLFGIQEVRTLIVRSIHILCVVPLNFCKESRHYGHFLTSL